MVRGYWQGGYKKYRSNTVDRTGGVVHAKFPILKKKSVDKRITHKLFCPTVKLTFPFLELVQVYPGHFCTGQLLLKNEQQLLVGKKRETNIKRWWGKHPPTTILKARTIFTSSRNIVPIGILLINVGCFHLRYTLCINS